MVNCCAFFAVRTEFLNIIEPSFGLKGLMGQSRNNGHKISVSADVQDKTGLKLNQGNSK
jgi:hypothetical protein